MSFSQSASSSFKWRYRRNGLSLAVAWISVDKIARVLKSCHKIRIMIDQKQLENVEYFNYLGSMITNDARCTREKNPELPWKKQQSTRRRLFSPANWT
jgi:hypothetical protein